jgi:hypothetical protein
MTQYAVISFLARIFSLKGVHHLKMYQHTTFHGFTLVVASFTSILKVLTYAISEWLRVRDQKLWHRGYFQ